MKKRVYCLYRVSTKGQVEKDDIPMQKQKCHEFAAQNGWEITREFSEKGVSGFNGAEPVNELGNEWGAYDLGLQNMLLCLKARELGLDTLIMGIRDGEAIRAAAQIPDTQAVFAVIALGYRDQDPSARPRKAGEEVVAYL